MKKKYIPIFVIIICLCLVIVKEMGMIDLRQEKIKQSSPAQESVWVIQEETPASENIGMDIPYEWNEVINDKNQIQALIEVPEQVRQKGFREVEAKSQEIDEQSVLSCLQDYYEPYEGQEYELCCEYLGNDEMKLFFDKRYGDISMTCHMDDYIRMAYRDQLSYDYNRDKYEIDENMEGFSIDECDDRIYKLWNSFGLEDELYIVHRALDHKVMKEEAYELHQDGEITIPNYNWDEKDNCYHCSVYQLCNGIPVHDSYRLNVRNDILNVGNHTFVVNKDRFISMNTSTMYTFRYGDKYEELISFEEILEKYRKTSELEMRDYSIKISRISMRVIAISDGENNYSMLPVWIFYGIQEDAIGKYPYVMIINALTGEEL